MLRTTTLLLVLALIPLSCVGRLDKSQARVSTQMRASRSDRWIGAQAPELGPNARDRVLGDVVSLRRLRGKRVLLYSFDAGDFVYGPEKGIFPENLRMLDRVRREAGPDRWAVVGFCDGVMFFFPSVDVSEELHHISDFPILPAAPGRHGKYPEPYDVLGRPGGIVIDCNGVIETIYTQAMTERQIRSAASLDD